VDLGALNERLGYFVRRFQVWIFQDFIRALAGVRIRPGQYSVLVVIGANPGLSQAELGRTLEIERARLARLLDGLQGRGLAKRVASTADRRSYVLYLTPGGEKLLTRVETLAARHEARLSRKIGAGPRRAMLAALRKFGLPDAA
jgi:DNA-binding MarR family transcriptional regulator